MRNKSKLNLKSLQQKGASPQKQCPNEILNSISGYQSTIKPSQTQ